VRRYRRRELERMAGEIKWLRAELRRARMAAGMEPEQRGG